MRIMIGWVFQEGRKFGRRNISERDFTLISLFNRLPP